MTSSINKISTIGMSYEDWLEQRRKTIGGSDASSIIGMNPWSSPYTVWADKLGKLPPKDDNEAMRQGRDLEDYVARRFMEQTGKKVRRENAILYNPRYPFAHADVDRMIVGEDAGLECKTTSSLNIKKYKNGEFPENYYCQCIHYMAVTGCKKWYLAVLVFGKDFMVFEIERDEDEIKALMDAEKEFWKYVETKEAPPADGTESTGNTISAIFKESSEDSANLIAYESDLQQYMAISEKIKELEAIRDESANRVKAFMGNAVKGDSAKYMVSWKTAQRNTFDTKKFASEHKEIDLTGYYKTSTYRTFKVTERKEN